jgi:hypothetical protein
MLIISLLFFLNWCAANGGFAGSLTGISIGAGVTSTQKIWRTLQAFGDIAFAYSFSTILIEIQVRNWPPLLRSVFCNSSVFF